MGVIMSAYRIGLGDSVDTESPALDMKLRRLSKRILEGNPINNKTFRKTWES